MQSKAKTVDEYMANLPEDRRDQISKVREVILENIPEGVVETMRWGMITYEIPLETYPNTYNGQPLMFAALASQKNHMAVYLIGIYGDESLREEFEQAYSATGKRMDIGKSCVRFKKLDDLPLFLVGKAIGAVSVDQLIAFYENSRSKK